ncbi:hypothetical protein BRADI_3g06067v3 [Brachypodium distachyon]|uniref:Uncharacterized protein n=1 Tax=Brachypodium distachyon TaxID=15368 RepID=A0A2K2CVH5_BRADI|nr:hypothetical protein BRADI_3g06067v3 [Brachypodium distachyon]
MEYGLPVRPVSSKFQSSCPVFPPFTIFRVTVRDGDRPRIPCSRKIGRTKDSTQCSNVKLLRIHVSTNVQLTSHCIHVKEK